MKIIDFEFISVIVEIIPRDAGSTGIAMIIGISGDFLGTEATSRRGKCLTVFFRFCIVIIIRVLQPVIDSIGICVSCPLSSIGDAGT